MDVLTKTDLEEALRAIISTMHKSEKALLKLKAGTSQHTMMLRGIKAYSIASGKIKGRLESEIMENLAEDKYTKEEMEEACRFLLSANHSIEKLLPRLRPGTPQHTLAMRRIEAFNIAMNFIETEYTPSD